MEDDIKPPPKNALQEVLVEDLSRLSEDELTERVRLLQGEITRTEAMAASKRDSRAHAEAVFKK